MDWLDTSKMNYKTSFSVSNGPNIPKCLALGLKAAFEPNSQPAMGDSWAPSSDGVAGASQKLVMQTFGIEW